jgi:hypothetical protein
MMKKGTTSGAAAVTSISPTTANGYLPQPVGNAVASLFPVGAITNGSPHISFRSKGDCEGINQQPETEKTGENRPLLESQSVQEEIIADLHQRMLRDAERRGVIGPDWQ